MVEAEMGTVVKCGFVYRIPDGRVFPVPIDESLRRQVRQAMEDMREVISIGSLPAPTEVRKRCEECEYANYCGDVW